MKNLITFFLIITAFTLFIYSCGEDTPTQTTNTNTNRVPDKPNHPYPLDSAENVDTSVVMVLSWQCSDPDPSDTVKYDVYVGNTLPVGTTPIVTDLTNPSYGLGIVVASTNYYWQVVAKDNHGGQSSSNVWRFRTKERQ